MIENASTLDELDLLGQLRTTNFTRSMLQRLLRPKWFQTNAVLGHARLFFSDFKPATTREDPDLYPLRDSDAALRDYLCYLLLDFTVVDPDLDEMPLAAALELSRELNMDANFEKLVARELHVKARDVKRLKEQAAAMLARAETAS
jgi:hypothetical protein